MGQHLKTDFLLAQFSLYVYKGGLKNLYIDCVEMAPNIDNVMAMAYFLYFADSWFHWTYELHSISDTWFGTEPWVSTYPWRAYDAAVGNTWWST